MLNDSQNRTKSPNVKIMFKNDNSRKCYIFNTLGDTKNVYLRLGGDLVRF